MKTLEQEECDVVIDTTLIPDVRFYIGCSILASSIRKLFENPETRAEYEEWLKSPEGQKAKERNDENDMGR